MNRLLTRRRLITTGLTTVAAASGLAAAARLADAYGLIPPDSGGIFGAGETLTYAAHRVLTSRHSMAREFSRADVSRIAPVNGGPPQSDDYQQALARNFAEWRLAIEGLVAKPASMSLDELRRLPARSQITQQACEEGWSFIAEWTGVPLSEVLKLVGVGREARYVVFYPFDTSWDSIDIDEAWHPQTLLAYGMNGKDLPPGHGAPLRLKVPRQLGYKNVKYLASIEVVDSLKEVGTGLGSSSPDYGYSWYAGI